MPEPRSRKKQEAGPRVLIAGADEAEGGRLAGALSRGGFDPHRTPSPESATLAVSYRAPAVVLLDADFLAATGFRILDNIRLCAPDVPVLVLAGAEDTATRLRALAMGAEDCIPRPFEDQEVLIRVRRALDRRRAAGRLRARVDESSERAEILSKETHALRTQLRRNVAMLQTAVDFHQRLEPDGDADAFRGSILRHLSAQVDVDRLAFLSQFHPGGTWMTVRSAWGLPQLLCERLRVQSNGELASLLRGTGAPLVVERMAQVPGLRLEMGILASAGFTAALPMLLMGDLLGVVLLGESKGGGPPPDEVLRLAQFLCSALVPALAAQDRWARDRHVSSDLLALLVSHLEARGPYLRGHSLRVARRAEAMGRALGLSGTDLSRLTVAGLLHDVGYFEVDVAVWTKVAPLTTADWSIIRSHPAEGVRLLSEASWDRGVIDAVRHHHERWDGSGYPDGLRGEAIPWFARILAVADVFEAMTSDRIHRAAVDPAEARRVLLEEADTLFDPDLVKTIFEPATLAGT